MGDRYSGLSIMGGSSATPWDNANLGLSQMPDFQAIQGMAGNAAANTGEKAMGLTDGGMLGAAGIGAGASLIGGILGNMAENRRRQWEMMQQGIQKGIQGQMDGANVMAQGQQSSLAQILQAMKGAYGA